MRPAFTAKCTRSVFSTAIGVLFFMRNPESSDKLFPDNCLKVGRKTLKKLQSNKNFPTLMDKKKKQFHPIHLCSEQRSMIKEWNSGALAFFFQ